MVPAGVDSLRWQVTYLFDPRLLFVVVFVRVQILHSYEDIGEQALGPIGRRLVAVFQSVTLFGVCTIFLIIIGGNMYTLVPDLALHVWSEKRERKKRTHSRIHTRALFPVPSLIVW